MSKQHVQRFEKIFEKNNPEKGGSFYLQSKVYFAKEHLMQDFPPEFNKSQYNPNPETAEKQEEAPKEENKEKKE